MAEMRARVTSGRRAVASTVAAHHKEAPRAFDLKIRIVIGKAQSQRDGAGTRHGSGHAADGYVIRRDQKVL